MDGDSLHPDAAARPRPGVLTAIQWLLGIIAAAGVAHAFQVVLRGYGENRELVLTLAAALAALWTALEIQWPGRLAWWVTALTLTVFAFFALRRMIAIARHAAGATTVAVAAGTALVLYAALVVLLDARVSTYLRRRPDAAAADDGEGHDD